jgi:hypothetical protein
MHDNIISSLGQIHNAPSPPNPDVSRTLRLTIRWEPSIGQTLLTAVCERGDDGDLYGPFEWSCSCHASHGPWAQVALFLERWWRAGPQALGVELQRQRKSYHCDDCKGSYSHP